tara:strand:+ start:1305 stop:1505 length:201 start_codon:yes stop_codon:yes gene_type:complete
MRIKVEGNDDLERDLNSGSLVNTNRTKYEKFLKNQERKESQETRLNTIENDIDEIKSLLKELLNRG